MQKGYVESIAPNGVTRIKHSKPLKSIPPKSIECNKCHIVKPQNRLIITANSNICLTCAEDKFSRVFYPNAKLTTKYPCQYCRVKTNEDQLLLCDGIIDGHGHTCDSMTCFKCAEVTELPEGDYYCIRCIVRKE